MAPQCAVRGRAAGQPWAGEPWASRRRHPRALGSPRRPHHVPAPAELAPEAGRGTLHKGTGLGTAAGEGVAFSRQRQPPRLKKKRSSRLSCPSPRLPRDGRKPLPTSRDRKQGRCTRVSCTTKYRPSPRSRGHPSSNLPHSTRAGQERHIEHTKQPLTHFVMPVQRT